jgi:hypothetical protein
MAMVMVMSYRPGARDRRGGMGPGRPHDGGREVMVGCPAAGHPGSGRFGGRGLMLDARDGARRVDEPACGAVVAEERSGDGGCWLRLVVARHRPRCYRRREPEGEEGARCQNGVKPVRVHA